MKTLIKIITISILILVLSSTSFAEVLYSPPVNVDGSDGTIECRIVNVGKNPIELSIRACTSVACAVYPSVSIVPGQIAEFVVDSWLGAGYCEFTIDGKSKDVRASACSISTDGSRACLAAQ